MNTLETIQKDLDDGKFGMICSNEATFKEYVLTLVKARDQELIKKLEEIRNSNIPAMTLSFSSDIVFQQGKNSGLSDAITAVKERYE